MNNIQFWIWLIVIVVTLIARARKKATVASRPMPKPEESSKPMTFEELLREIEASKPVSKSEPEPVDYELETREEPKSLERTDYTYPQPEKTYDIYEKAKREAFNRPSLEETLKLEDTVIRFDPFEDYKKARKQSLAAEIAREIRNPAGFRKAFIMSEILNRRF